MSDSPQSRETHARYVPLYHGVLTGLLLVILAWAVRGLVRAPGVDSVVTLLLAVSLVLLGWFARSFAVTVQDRVIRLEETLRMERLLPADLKPRIRDLTRAQFVALRFASDEELPDLVRAVLNESLHDKDAIKTRIRTWRPDHLRA